MAGVLQIIPGDRHTGGAGAAAGRAQELAEERKKAKWAKDWGKADQLRKALLDIGFEVRDTPDGGYQLRRVTPPPTET